MRVSISNFPQAMFTRPYFVIEDARVARLTGIEGNEPSPDQHNYYFEGQWTGQGS